MTESDSSSNPTADTPPLPALNARWASAIRAVVLVIFGVLTGYGAYVLATNDWQDITGFWLTRRRLLLAGFALASLDVCTDGFVWYGILRQYGIRLGPVRGLLLFLSGYAGHFMPVQMGRFFRATELSRIYGVPLATSTKAEITLLAFIMITSVAMFCGAFLWPWLFALAFAIPPLLTAMALLVLGIFFRWIKKLSIQLPEGYLRRPSTLALCLCTGIGWFINGFILYLIFREVTETLQLNHAIMIMTSNLFIGVVSGLPGGLGITESYIGGMMYWLATPPEHLVIAVAAFRILTFWLWIPIGWIALLLNGLFFGRSKRSLKPEPKKQRPTEEAREA